MKTQPWKIFKSEALEAGKLPLMVWGTHSNGRREVIEQGEYDNDREIADSLSALSSCFHCFQSVFHCHIDSNGKFRSVTSS